MPGLNGTGPEGKGPLTGRRLGRCFRNVSTSGKMKLMSIAIPTVVAVIDDIRRPDGITRRIYSALKTGIREKIQKKISETSGSNLKDIPDNRVLKR